MLNFLYIKKHKKLIYSTYFNLHLLKRQYSKNIYQIDIDISSYFINNYFETESIFQNYCLNMVYQKYLHISYNLNKYIELIDKYIELIDKYKSIKHIKYEIDSLFKHKLTFCNVVNQAFLFGFIYCNINKKTYFNTFVYPQICGT